MYKDTWTLQIKYRNNHSRQYTSKCKQENQCFNTAASFLKKQHTAGWEEHMSFLHIVVWELNFQGSVSQIYLPERTNTPIHKFLKFSPKDNGRFLSCC